MKTNLLLTLSRSAGVLARLICPKCASFRSQESTTGVSARRALALATVCGLPFAGFAQGTYLSDPNDPNNHALVVAPGGDVGIGTTSPQARLHIEGGSSEITLRRGDGSHAAYISGNPALNHGAGRMILYKADGEDGVYLNSAGHNYFLGRVGIGTRDPQTWLDVSGDSVFRGNVCIGTTSPRGLLHIRGWHPGCWLESTEPGTDVFRIVSGGYGGNNYGLGIVDVTGDAVRVLVRNDGNVGIGTTTPQAKLDVAGKVNCTVLELTSDRAQKSGFAPVDRRAILDRLARLPLTTWHYTNEPTVRHLGPVAQDFKTAFNLGSDDQHIATVDADGVALASIQALYDIVKDRDARIAALEQKLDEQEHSFAARLAAVEKWMAMSARPERPSPGGEELRAQAQP